MTLDEPIRALPGVDMLMLDEKSYVFCVLSWDEVNPEAVCGPVPPLPPHANWKWTSYSHGPRGQQRRCGDIAGPVLSLDL